MTSMAPMPSPRPVLSLLVPLLVLGACATGSSSGSQTSTTPATGASCEYPVSGQPARTVDPPSTTNVARTGTASVTLKLDGKPVTITMDRSKTPCTVNSFESLAKQGWYTNTKCHRLVDQGIFILQCGDPTGTGRGGPGYSFADELTGSETYPKGTVAMANAGPNTNGSQVFLVWEDTQLDPSYTVFGQMDAASTDAVAAIAAQGVAADNVSPNAPALITDVTLG